MSAAEKPVGRSPSPPRIAIGVVGAIWILLTINLVLAVGRFQSNVLAWDQWDLATPLLSGATAWDLFNFQHGPHRQGLAFIFTSWILELSAWDARVESLWIGSLLSASGLLAMQLKWKLSGTIRFSDTWIVFMALSLGQFEALLFAPNASHSAFPLLLLMIAANLWLLANPLYRFLSAGILSFCLTFTGFGIFGSASLTLLLALAILRAVLRRDGRPLAAASVGLLVAVAGWTLFFRDYVFTPAAPDFRFPWTPVADYVPVVWATVLSTARPGELGPISYAIGFLLIAVVLAAFVRAGRSAARSAEDKTASDVALLLLATGIAYVISIALGRVSLGADAGTASRYLTLMFPLWLGTALVFQSFPSRTVRIGVAASLWVLALWPMRDLPSRPLREWPGTLGVTDADKRTITSYADGKALWLETYLETGDIERAQEAAGDVIYPDPVATHMAAKLDQLRSKRLLFFAEAAHQDAYRPWLSSPTGTARK